MNDDEPSTELRYPRQLRNDRTTMSGGAAIWLAVACVSTTLLALLSWFEAHGAPVPRVVGSLLAAGIAVGGSGVIVQTAADRVMRRLDRLERQIRQYREEGYAEGYVAATAGRPRLQAVNDR